ncbi:MAG: hypothetical protein ABSG25_02555 [Bryobacteraceae bacterium]
MNKTVKRIIWVVLAVVCLFLTVRLLDILMAWSVYSWFFRNIQEIAGLPDTLNGAVSIWLTVVTILIIPTFLSVLFFRHTAKKLSIIALAVSGMLVLFYFLAQPKQGQYFNPVTGKAMYRYYKAENGKIELFPLGYMFHPRYGVPLLDFTPQIIGEMEKQQVKEEEEDRQRALELVRQREEERQKGQASAPPVVTALALAPAPPARLGVANLEDFRVLKDGSTDGQWEFQLDARQPWQALHITISDGDEVEFSATGLVCGGVNVGCVGPNGQDGPAEASTNNPGEFPVGKAFAQSLVARIGSDQFQVGDHKTYVVPNGTGQKSIELMDNYRQPYIALASGGFRVSVTIRKK